MTNMKARKIATLFKFSKLSCQLEEATDPETKPHILKTAQG
jgi:hypothetical protein